MLKHFWRKRTKNQNTYKSWKNFQNHIHQFFENFRNFLKPNFAKTFFPNSGGGEATIVSIQRTWPNAPHCAK